MKSRYCLKNISKSVKDKKILDNISIDFKQGLNIIIGESGSGKSTLLNILGIIDNPSDGDIFFNEEKLTGRTDIQLDDFRAENIGFIFQSSNLISDITVDENLKLAMEINNIDTADYKKMLERFKIDDLIDKKVNVLSGGEQQRVSIVRALLKNSSIILADEPTGNLDKGNSKIVFETLKECAEIYNKIVIVVTHDQRLAREYADYIVELEDGKIISAEVINKSEKETIKSEFSKKNKETRKLDIKRKIHFSKNYIKRKPWKVMITAFITAITIALPLLVLDINSQTTSMFDKMDTNYLETDLIEINQKAGNPKNTVEYGVVFNEEELEEIRNSDLFAEITEIIPLGIAAKSGDVQIDIENIRYVKTTDFYKNRVMNNDIDGEFIADKNEIILGKDIAYVLFGNENPIGNTIYLTCKWTEIPVTIVGVNNTQNIEGDYLTFMDNELCFEMTRKTTDKYLYISPKDEVNANTSNIYSGGIGGTYGYEKTYPLLMGRYPEENEENKIAIDISMMDLYEENEDEKIIFNKEFYLQICNIFEVEVCGVYDSNLEQGIYINNKLQEKINNPAPSVVYCYAKNQEIVREFDKYDINDKYDCFTMYRHLIGSVSDKTHTMREILVIIAFLLVFISFFTISSFVNISISERTYEIGILRALGCNKKDIKGIFYIQSLITGCIGAVMSVGIFCISKLFIDNKILENVNNKWMLLFMSAIILCCISLVMISSIPPLRKINKMKPIDCIRCKQ